MAKQINTVVTRDGTPEEPRVLTLEETDLFLQATSHYRYYNEFSLALETGRRIGEIIGLKWSDIDFPNRTIYVNRTLIYISQMIRKAQTSENGDLNFMSRRQTKVKE